MLNSEASAAAALSISPPALRTATFSSGWTNISAYEGELAFIQSIGTVTGTTPTLTCVLEDADDNSGTNSATLSGASYGERTAAGIQKLVIEAGRPRPWVRITCTIGGTSPSFPHTVIMMGRPKIV